MSAQVVPAIAFAACMHVDVHTGTCAVNADVLRCSSAIAASAPAARRCDEQDLAGLLLGLYRMRFHPGSRWLDRFAATLATKASIVSAQKHALLVSLLRAMGYSAAGRPFDWVMDEAAAAAMRGRNGDSGGSARRPA